MDSISELATCNCHDCGQPLDAQRQADGNGGFYVIVTCRNAHCLLRSVTRSLTTYLCLTDDELELYRDLNRIHAQAV